MAEPNPAECDEVCLGKCAYQERSPKTSIRAAPTEVIEQAAKCAIMRKIEHTLSRLQLF